MKVYLIYEGKNSSGELVSGSGELFKVKCNVPEEMANGPCERLVEQFVSSYQLKHPSSNLEAKQLELKCGSIVLRGSDKVSQYIHDYNDVSVLHKAEVKQAQHREGEMVCSHFGCGKYFLEEENTDTSCHFHSKGPVFHDLGKHWGCCDSKKAFDWEDFLAIPTCQVGRHSSAPPLQAMCPPQCTNNTPIAVPAQISTPCAPIDGARETTGPREFEGAQHHAPQEIKDGKAKCRNFGCGKEFIVADNSDSACTYHEGGPVFWDTYKYWKCCPKQKCYEFDDFVKIPGCCKGAHKL